MPPLDKLDLASQLEALCLLREKLVDAVAPAGVDVLAQVASLAGGVDVKAELVALGIDPERAAFAVAAGCATVEQAMELVFGDEAGSAAPPPPPAPLKQVLVVRSDIGMSAAAR